MLLSTSQASVEQKLDKLISDFQQGKRAPSVVSLQTVDSLDPDDKEAWRTIRKELEDIGISVAAFDANKDFIFEWFSNVVDTRAFQEQAVSSPSGSVHSLDVLSSASSLSGSDVQESKQTVIKDMKPPEARKFKSNPDRNNTITHGKSASNGIVAGSGPHAPVIHTKVPRFAALIASVSQPKRRLIKAVIEDDVKRVKKILTSPATSRLIDRPAMDAALQSATLVTSEEAYALLIDAGADINYGSAHSRPLTTAVLNGRKGLVTCLLDKGADVNFQDGDGLENSSALRAAITQNDAAMITLLSQRGADINAVQNASYNASKWPQYPYPTAIHHASAESSVSVVDLLINLGADLTYSYKGFGTPLMLAIYNNRLATAKVLIKKGANVNVVPVPLGFDNALFRSIIHMAIFWNSPALVKLLLDNCAVTDWENAYMFAQEQTLPTFMSRGHEHGALEVLELIKKKKGQELLARNGPLYNESGRAKDDTSLFWAGMTVKDTEPPS